MLLKVKKAAPTRTAITQYAPPRQDKFALPDEPDAYEELIRQRANHPAYVGSKKEALRDGQRFITEDGKIVNPAPELDAQGMPIHARNAKGVPICGALLKALSPDRRISNRPAIMRYSGICDSTELTEEGRCKKHSRLVRNFVNRYGERVPTRARAFEGLDASAAYVNLLNDPNLLSNVENIGTVEVFIQQLIEEGDIPGALWKNCLKVIHEYRKSQREEPDKTLRISASQTINTVEATLEDGLEASGRIDRIERLTDTSRKHKESEHKRQMDSENVRTVTQFVAFMSSVLQVIKDEVKNPADLERVKTGLSKISIPGTIRQSYQSGQ